jgi:hypothetical protein
MFPERSLMFPECSPNIEQVFASEGLKVKWTGRMPRKGQWPETLLYPMPYGEHMIQPEVAVNQPDVAVTLPSEEGDELGGIASSL